MNNEQKQRAIKLITYWRNRSITTMPEECFVSGDCMTDLLQELIDAPEPEPVGYTNETELDYVRKYEALPVSGTFWPTSDEDACVALYTAPPANNQSEQHLEMVNPPAPSVPDGWLEILEAVLREMPARKGVNGNAPGHGHRIAGIWDDDNGPLSGKPCAWCMTWNKAKAMLAEQQPEQPADLVRDAERYRWLRNWTRRAYGIDSNPAFILPHVPIPTGPDQNIMRGSLAQHLDNAIDAAIERDKKGDQS